MVVIVCNFVVRWVFLWVRVSVFVGWKVGVLLGVGVGGGVVFLGVVMGFFRNDNGRCFKFFCLV